VLIIRRTKSTLRRCAALSELGMSGDDVQQFVNQIDRSVCGQPFLGSAGRSI
jgi:hypothetical protein